MEGAWLAHIDMWNTDTPLRPQMDDDSKITNKNITAYYYMVFIPFYPAPSALKAELAALNEVYCAAWKAQDFSTVGSFYTEDA